MIASVKSQPSIEKEYYTTTAPLHVPYETAGTYDKLYQVKCLKDFFQKPKLESEDRVIIYDAFSKQERCAEIMLTQAKCHKAGADFLNYKYSLDEFSQTTKTRDDFLGMFRDLVKVKLTYRPTEVMFVWIFWKLPSHEEYDQLASEMADANLIVVFNADKGSHFLKKGWLYSLEDLIYFLKNRNAQLDKISKIQRLEKRITQKLNELEKKIVLIKGQADQFKCDPNSLHFLFNKKCATLSVIESSHKEMELTLDVVMDYKTGKIPNKKQIQMLNCTIRTSLKDIDLLFE